MADRYWVGGSGTWDSSTTTNWSSTSGGSGGASAPTSSDNVYFDQNGPYNVGMSSTSRAYCKNLTVTGTNVSFVNTVTSFRSIDVYGDFTLHSSTYFGIGYASLRFYGTDNTDITITTNGVAIDAIAVYFSRNFSTSYSYSLNGSFTATNSNVYFYKNFNLNGYTLTANLINSSSALGNPIIDFGTNGSIICTTGDWTLYSNYTINGTGTINMSSSYGQSFTGGGINYPVTIAFNSSSGYGLTITDSGNTFENIKNNSKTGTLTLPSGTTTFNNFNIKGAIGYSKFNITGNASSGSTISKSSGTVFGKYLNVANTTATGGATWYAGGSTLTNSTGWVSAFAPIEGTAISLFFNT